MNAPVLSTLQTFNTFALHYQDEVFTLAYYLLGDESRAAETAQKAFERVYQHSGGMRLEGFRLQIFRSVLEAYPQRAGVAVTGRSTKDDLCRQLMVLETEEREAVVLVDVIGLSYAEAGLVLRCSKKQVCRLVTQARLNLKAALPLPK